MFRCGALNRVQLREWSAAWAGQWDLNVKTLVLVLVRAFETLAMTRPKEGGDLDSSQLCGYPRGAFGASSAIIQISLETLSAAAGLVGPSLLA